MTNSGKIGSLQKATKNGLWPAETNDVIANETKSRGTAGPMKPPERRTESDVGLLVYRVGPIDRFRVEWATGLNAPRHEEARMRISNLPRALLASIPPNQSECCGVLMSD